MIVKILAVGCCRSHAQISATGGRKPSSRLPVPSRNPTRPFPFLRTPVQFPHARLRARDRHPTAETCHTRAGDRSRGAAPKRSEGGRVEPGSAGTRPREPSHQSHPSTTAPVSFREVLDAIAAFTTAIERLASAQPPQMLRTPPLRSGRKRCGPPPSAPGPSPEGRDVRGRKRRRRAAPPPRVT